MSRIRAVLIDLSGTIHIGNNVIPKSPEALERLRGDKDLLIKFVTNTSSESVGSMVVRLQQLGFKLTISEIHSSLSATARYVQDHQLRPFCFLSPDALQEIPNSSSDPEMIEDRNAVVVGLAPDLFDFQHMNAAFQILKFQGGRLIAVNENKLVKRELDTIFGPGLVVKGLEYSTDQKAVLIGKPNAFMFESAIPDGLKAAECVMIGDDPAVDLEGAKSLGMQTVLVKTGKNSDNSGKSYPASYHAKDFSAACDWIQQYNASKPL